MKKPVNLIVVGLVLLVIGVVLPFLMVMEFVGSTFVLNFVAAICQISGLVVGFIGIAVYMAGRRRGD